jgi:hypothetical protein
MISDKAFADSAAIIGCQVAAIKAVSQVESGGSGFLPTGEPTILFEPHIFWKQLRLVNIDPAALLAQHPEYSDILYPVWGTKPYGKVSAQHARLARAVAINKEAAFKSASWGKFQIMGFNYAACGCSTLQEFINDMYASEDLHLQCFTTYIKTEHLDDELRNLDWAGFSLGYNGPLYRKNGYDTKLAAAYNSFK